MRRVFALMGFSSFFISLFCIKFGKEFSLVSLVVSAIALIIVLSFKKLRLSIIIVLLSTFCLVTVNCYFTESKIEEYNSTYCSGDTFVKGTLLDYPEESETGFNYVFKTTDDNQVKFSVHTNEPLDLEPGDIISGSFYFTDSYADKSEKIYFSTSVYYGDDYKIIKQNNNTGISAFRKTLKQGIIDNTTYARGLSLAIIFGDKSGLTDELYNYLLKCGLLHATATSGLHLTIITGFVFALLSFLGISRRKSSLIAIVFIVLFMIVIGFKFSLMRAGIMMIMYYLSYLFNREGDAFNSIGLAVLVLHIINPYTAVSCSFLLSASATIGMIVVFGPMSAKIERMKQGGFALLKRILFSFVASVLQSVSAILFTLPVTYIFFGYFSIAGILANAVLSMFIALLLTVGVVLCLASFVPVISELLGVFLDLVSFVIINTVKYISKFKYCLISIDYDFMAMFFFICSLIIAAGIILYYFLKADKQKIIRVSALLCLNSFMILILISYLLTPSSYNVKVQNSGNGILISTVINKNMIVIDTGGKNVEKKLQYEMTRQCIDDVTVCIVPIDNKNAYSSASVISRKFNADTVVCNKKLVDEANYNIYSKVVNIENTNTVAVAEFKIKIINQLNSCALYLTNSQVSVLIIDRLTACADLKDEFKKCDAVILKDLPPDDISEVKTDNIILQTYDSDVEQSLAKKYNVYSLRNQSLDLKMQENLLIRSV